MITCFSILAAGLALSTCNRRGLQEVPHPERDCEPDLWQRLDDLCDAVHHVKSNGMDCPWMLDPSFQDLLKPCVQAMAQLLQRVCPTDRSKRSSVALVLLLADLSDWLDYGTGHLLHPLHDWLFSFAEALWQMVPVPDADQQELLQANVAHVISRTCPDNSWRPACVRACSKLVAAGSLDPPTAPLALLSFTDPTAITSTPQLPSGPNSSDHSQVDESWDMDAELAPERQRAEAAAARLKQAASRLFARLCECAAKAFSDDLETAACQLQWLWKLYQPDVLGLLQVGGGGLLGCAGSTVLAWISNSLTSMWAGASL